MKPKWIKRLALGEAQALLAEAWFNFLGFVLITAAVHAAAEKSGVLIITLSKWVCYIGIWWWSAYKVDSLSWILVPSVKPEAGKQISNRVLMISITISTNLAFFAYFFSVTVIKVISDLSST